MHRAFLIGSAVARRVSRAVVKPKPPNPPPSEVGPDQAAGLYLVCAVELLERLGSAMVFCLLVLYLNEYLGLGTGWAARVTSYLYMLSYAAAIPGGMLGDRRLGARSAALLGLALLALGYGTLACVLRSPAGLLIATFFAVAGSGLFKPNCTALIGALYEPGHPRRGKAFYWFYYAINLGSMVAPCVGGVVRAALGWEAMFRLAAGFIVLAWGLLALGSSYLSNGARRSEATLTKPVELLSYMGKTQAGASQTGALLFVLSVLAIFGAVLSQGYGTLLLWVRDDARRSVLGYVIPPDFFAALPAAFVLICGPLLERGTQALAGRGIRLGDSLKFTLGMLLCALAYSLMLAASLFPRGSELASPLWLVGCKIALALGELLGVPVALALAESLARARTKGLTLGLSYGAHALGFWLGGEVSALWPRCSHAVFFALLAGSCLGAAAMIHAQSPRLARRLTLRQ